MLSLMLGMMALGGVLLLAAPWLARLLVRGRDPIGMTRVLQAIGAALLIGALLARPHSPEVSAFPPPPDGADASGR